MRKIFLLVTVLMTLSIACVADDTIVAGNSGGSFGVGSSSDIFLCPDGNLCGSNESGISFSPSSFGVATSGGTGALELGAIHTFLGLEEHPASNYDGSTLTLTLDFSSPGGVIAETFVAHISGSIGGDYAPADQIFFTFEDPARTIAYNGGSFVLTLHDVTLGNSDQQSITGAISSVSTVTAVPEPASLLLMATGLSGVGALRRKKK